MTGSAVPAIAAADLPADAVLLDVRETDEWAAGHDPDFKAIFYHQLIPEMKAAGKTVVAVTHDDAYYHVADRLVRLEDGRIASVTSAHGRAAGRADVLAPVPFAPSTIERP